MANQMGHNSMQAFAAAQHGNVRKEMYQKDIDLDSYEFGRYGEWLRDLRGGMSDSAFMNKYAKHGMTGDTVIALRKIVNGTTANFARCVQLHKRPCETGNDRKISKRFNRPLYRSDMDAIHAMFEKGVSLEDIGNVMDLAPHNVGTLRYVYDIERGIQSKRSKTTIEEIELIKKLTKEGKTQKEIAAETGIEYNAVWKVAYSIPVDEKPGKSRRTLSVDEKCWVLDALNRNERTCVMVDKLGVNRKLIYEYRRAWNELRLWGGVSTSKELRERVEFE